MATIASRLTNSGTLLVNGNFDEITQNTISTNTNTILSSLFDEVSNFGNSIARRDCANGTVQISGIFDEITGAPLIDGNLKFWIDAAQTTSYAGSGTTWYDLSSSQSNVTLYGSPSFSSSVTGGNIKFVPGSTQYGLTTTNLGNMPKWTAEVWVKVNSSLTGQVSSAVTNQYNLSNALNYSIGTNKAPTDYKLCIGFFDGAWHNTAGFDPAVNTWYQVVGTYDGTSLQQYVNGTANGSAVSYTGTASSGGVTRIARRWDDTTVSTNLFPGDIAVVRIYNRALTADEVGQNFNSHRRRFNI